MLNFAIYLQLQSHPAVNSGIKDELYYLILLYNMDI